MNIKQIIKEEIQAVLREDESSGRMREALSAISDAGIALSDLKQVEGLPADVYEDADNMMEALKAMVTKLDSEGDYERWREAGDLSTQLAHARKQGPVHDTPYDDYD